MILKQKMLLAFVLGWCATCSLCRDVANVSFRGSCTGFGMKIEAAYFADGSFLVITTGARFEYAAGELKIYQGLGNSINKRLLATIAMEGAGKFEKVESNDDHVLLWSENLNVGIYGDSTCILAPKVNLDIKCRGNFKPDYEGRYKGELLLIDDLGGMEIYPQRYEAGYKVRKIELGKKDWVAEYMLNAGERVMVAAFPGRAFDWEKSFNSHIVITYGGMGFGIGNVYGQMPSESDIRQWSLNLRIIVMFYQGLYKNLDYRKKYPLPGGPYIVANEPEFRRFMQTAHKYGMKVAPYTSLFYHYKKLKTIESYFKQVKSLRDKYGVDGVYIDGLLFDYRLDKSDDKIANWEMIRRLRQLFGADGVIILHGTHGAQLGNPVATAPNIDAYCDATLNGEAVYFKSANDPYIKYQVRKYGISNTIGLWKKGKHPGSVTDKDIADAEMRMNCRKTWGSYVPLKDPPPDNKYVWGTKQDGGYFHYRKKLIQWKNNYYKQK